MADMQGASTPWWARDTRDAVLTVSPVVAGFFVVLFLLVAGAAWMAHFIVSTVQMEHMAILDKVSSMAVNDDHFLQSICIHTARTQQEQNDCTPSATQTASTM